MRHYQHNQTASMAAALRRLADQLDAYRSLDLVAPTSLHVDFQVSSSDMTSGAPEHVRRVLVDNLARIVSDDQAAGAPTAKKSIYSTDNPYNARTDMVVTVYTTVDPADDGA